MKTWLVFLQMISFTPEACNAPQTHLKEIQSTHLLLLRRDCPTDMVEAAQLSRSSTAHHLAAPVTQDPNAVMYRSERPQPDTDGNGRSRYQRITAESIVAANFTEKIVVISIMVPAVGKLQQASSSSKSVRGMLHVNACAKQRQCLHTCTRQGGRGGPQEGMHGHRSGFGRRGKRRAVFCVCESERGGRGLRL